MQKDIIYLIAAIDLGYVKGLTFIDVKKNLAVLKLCKLFVREGIIKSFDSSFLFYKHKFSILRVYLIHKSFLSYNARKKFKPYSQIRLNSKSVFYSSTITYKDLKKLSRFNIIYIISSDRGFLTDSEAIKLKIGGTLICKILI